MRSPEQYINALEGEYHISSAIVQFKPEFMCRVNKCIHELEGAEVHASDDQGKLVVVVESDTERGMASIIDQIKDINGVANVSLVYDQVDDDPDSEVIN